jgi:hypothetical protein
MTNQRPSFAKRDREMKLKDKARAKAERRAAKRAAKSNGSATDPDAPGPGEGAIIDDVPAPAMPPGPTDPPR